MSAGRRSFAYAHVRQPGRAAHTGTDMEPQVIERVFKPFFTTEPVGQGTGLGLSMMYGFARQSGGQVRIYSEVGMGTTVCIYLPWYHGEPVNDAPDGSPSG